MWALQMQEGAPTLIIKHHLLINRLHRCLAITMAASAVTLALPLHAALFRELQPLACDNAFPLKACPLARLSCPSCLAPRASASPRAAVLRESFELAEDSAPQAQEEEGPIELRSDDLQLDLEEVSPLRIGGSIVLTGAIGFFLFRSLRRRAKLAKETKFRSTGAEKVVSPANREALNLPKKPSSDVAPRAPPSVFQTLLGALISGGIAVVLYKFTTIVEGGFAVKPVSTAYTVRQLTITVRTIINGLCYLATFVFAANCLGLTLYSLQLALNLEPSQPPSPPDGSDDMEGNAKTMETTISDEVKED